MKRGKRSLVIASAILVFFLPPAAADQAPRMDKDLIRLEDPVFDNEDAFCRAGFEDVDDTSGRIKFVWVIDGVNVENQTFVGVSDGDVVESILESFHYGEGDQMKCQVIAMDDYGGADEQRNSSFEEYFIQTDPPNVTQGPEFSNYSSEHAFNVSAVVEDREGESDVTSCQLTVEDEDGHTFNAIMDMKQGYGGQETLRCFYSSVSNYTHSGFDPLDRLEVTVTAMDSGGDSNYTKAFNTLPNSLPRIYNVRPEDDSRTATDDIALEANVLDNDGEDVDVTFYNTTGGVEKLYEETGVSGGTVSYVWPDLQSLKTYYWVINASDGHATRSMKLNFRNLISSQFRVQTRIEHRYSAVLASSDGSKIVSFTAKNTASDTKNLESTITTGVDAEFVSEGDKTVSYSLAPGQTREFQVRVSPSSDGRRFLNITTENDAYAVSTKESIEVFPRRAAATAPEVPGIGGIYILLILLASTLYYSVRP